MPEINLTIVIENLLEEKHLLSANEILAHLKSQGRTYNKTSVYRALEQLLHNNTICRHHFTDGEATYELREHHHAHLVCTKCSEVFTGECTYQQPVQIGDFKVDHHHTTLFGLCGNCQHT